MRIDLQDPNLTDLKKFVQRNTNVQLNRPSNRHTGVDIFQFILQRMRRRAAEQFIRGDHEASQSSITSTSDDDPEVDDIIIDRSQLGSCNPS